MNTRFGIQPGDSGAPEGRSQVIAAQSMDSLSGCFSRPRDPQYPPAVERLVFPRVADRLGRPGPSDG